MQGGILLIPRDIEKQQNNNQQMNGHGPKLIKDVYIPYAVLDTCHLMQGYVDESTKIYVQDELLGRDIETESSFKKLIFFCHESTTTDRAISSVSAEVAPNMSGLKFDFLDSFNAMLPFQKTTMESLRLILLNYPILSPQPVPTHRDYEIEVGVTMKTLRTLGVLSGGWILIRNIEKAGTERICRVYALDPPPKKEAHISIFSSDMSHHKVYEDGALYVPPSILFNMMAGNGNAKISVINVSEEMEVFFKGGKYATKKPLKGLISCATEAHVGRVNNPDQNLTDFCRKALRSHFKSPRIYKVGDVFGVLICKKKFASGAPLYDYDSDESESEDEPLLENIKKCKDKTYNVQDDELTEIAYFKLMKATAETHDSLLVIDIDKTTLFQDGLCNSTIPPNHDMYTIFCRHKYALKRAIPHTDRIIPPNEDSYNKLKALVEPCLNQLASRIGLYLTVILHGKQGVGKKSMIRSIAKEYGIHVIQSSSYDLVGNIDKHSDAKVKKMFKDAQRFAPCILMLNDLEAFDMAKDRKSVV